MAGIGNSLYPPIMPTYQAAFIYTNACRIYFSLSPYNSYESILKDAQITVSYQNTNISALDSEKYPTGIMLKNVSKDESIEGDNKYYIEISPDDIEPVDEKNNIRFEPDAIYKVQIRFTEATASNLLSDIERTNGKIASWLSNNQAYFSEWSTICLIKSIYEVQFYLNGFPTEENENDLVFTSELNTFIGGINFIGAINGTQEKLKSYQIIISKNEEIYYDSGECYPNKINSNEFNHTVTKLLEDGSHYDLKISYLTSNGYSNSKNYTFTIIQNTIEAMDVAISAEPDVENGRIKINIVSNASEVFFGNLVIRRSSSKTNYSVWEDVHQQAISDGQILNYFWYDYTVESGIWYKYCVQKKNSNGDRGAITSIRNSVMIELEDMFLTRAEMQFKVKFDPTVSSFKRTYLESRTETLGSKYPFIRRNGSVEYRQFPISGLITGFCDEEGLFLNKDNLYENAKEDYANYNSQNQINEYIDRIYEKQFRDKIMDFLYADNLKLFRSQTEGNILVRLMDINLSPNQSLGRMLYSFTATAYEIDDCTIQNFDMYGIQYLGTFEENLSFIHNVIGQLNDNYSYQNVNNDILKILREKYTKTVLDKYINTVECLNWVRITFNSEPYLIKMSNGIPVKHNKTDKVNEDVFLGYIVYINKQPIIVSPKGYYELVDKDTYITSLYFPYVENVTIDYMAHIIQTENISLNYSQIFFNTKAGQIYNLFDSEKSVFKEIYMKYLINNSAYHQELMSLNEITVESDPGAVLYIKDSFDEDFFRHEVGPTGILKFYDEESIIVGMYFKGYHLYKKETNIQNIEDSKYFEIYKNDEIQYVIRDLQNPELYIPYKLDIKVSNLAEVVNDTLYINDELMEDGSYIKIAEDVTQNSIELASVFTDSDFIYVNERDFIDLREIIGEIQNLDRITKPIKNCLYNIQGQTYIYYKNKWYIFDEANQDVLSPVQGLIDYIYELMKGEYAKS